MASQTFNRLLQRVIRAEMSNDKDELYLRVKELSSLMARGFYRDLDDYDIDIIAHEVARQIVENKIDDQTFTVQSWPRYLSILIRRFFHETYRSDQLLQLGDPESFELLKEEITPSYREYDLSTCVDASVAARQAYRDCMRIVSELPLKNPSIKNLLGRIALIAVTSNPHFIEIIDQPIYRKIAAACSARIKDTLRSYQPHGLLISCESLL